MKSRILLPALLFAGGVWLNAAPLTESTFTEVVKDVNVVASTTKAATPASVKAVVKAPDLVRTGPESRAELTAADQTITRVGANTVFSFEPAGRNINLERGSLLFHSPSGKGGGTIKSGGAAAAVLGSTVIVVATPGGGFKVIVLEHKCKVTLPNGKSVTLKEGQLVFVLPGGKDFSEVLDINLAKLIAGSLLVKGFSQELPSMPLLKEAMKRQDDLIAKGRAKDLGIPADEFARKRRVGTLDNDAYAMLTIPEYVKQVQSQHNNANQPPGNTGQGTSVGLGVQSTWAQADLAQYIGIGDPSDPRFRELLQISRAWGESGPEGSTPLSRSDTSLGFESSRAGNKELIKSGVPLPPRPTGSVEKSSQ